MTFTYDTKPLKGYNPMLAAVAFAKSYLPYAHPELFGSRTNQLATKIVSNGRVEVQGTATYDEITYIIYTLDDDDYVSHCDIKIESTEKMDGGQNYYEEYIYSYDFTWKQIVD